jgi:hypothetical protein
MCRSPIGKTNKTRCGSPHYSPRSSNAGRTDPQQTGTGIDCLDCLVHVSNTRTWLSHTKGKEAKSKKDTDGTLFLDHAMQYIHCHHQVSLRVGDTLEAKNNFEKKAKESGHKVTNYCADKAPFRAKVSVQDCVNKGQTIDCSGPAPPPSEWGCRAVNMNRNNLGKSNDTPFNYSLASRGAAGSMTDHRPGSSHLHMEPYA